MAAKGTIYGINGPIVYIAGDSGFQMNEMVYVGEANLVGEVIGLTSERTTIEVYEETTDVYKRQYLGRHQVQRTGSLCREGISDSGVITYWNIKFKKL